MAEIIFKIYFYSLFKPSVNDFLKGVEHVLQKSETQFQWHEHFGQICIS